MLSSKMKTIKDKITSSEIKLVSFDLFDTLVLRPCCTPVDMFEIVARRSGFQGEFVLARQQAEKQARKNKPYYDDDITIYDIYRELMNLMDVSQTEADKLMTEELAVEMEHLYARESVKTLYEQAKAAGKKVIVTTDVYLPYQFIENVLSKNGYKDYDNLYVSSKERLIKGTGRLFSKILVEYADKGIQPNQIIHIGDNYSVDFKRPVELGMQAIHIPSCVRIMQSKSRLDELRNYSRRTDNRFLTGLLANYLFDDPFLPFNNASISGGYDELLGSVLYGPFILSYVKWLIESAKAQHIDCIVFVYRDGYLLKQIFERLEEIYGKFDKRIIYLSRSIRYNFFGMEKNGLINTLKDFPIPTNMTVLQFINKRLHVLKQDEIQAVWKIFLENGGYENINDEMGTPEKYFHILKELEPVFKEKTCEQGELIRDYCISVIPENKSLAIVDVGYRGSVGTFLKDKFQITSITYQIFSNPIMRDNSERKYGIHSFLMNGFETISKSMILHPLTEDIISIQEGTASKIIKQGNEYKIEKEELHENIILDNLQKGVRDFSIYCIEHLGKDIQLLDFDRTLYWEFILNNLKDPAILDAKIIAGMDFKDCEFIRINDNNVYKEWFESRKFIQTNTEPRVIPVQNTTKGDGTVKNEMQPCEQVSKVHLYAIKLCERLHIINQAIFIKKWLKDPFFAEQNRTKIKEFFVNDLEVKIAEIKKGGHEIENNVIFAGAMASFDKGACNFINMLSHEFINYNCLVLSEANKRGTKDKFKLDSYLVPDFLIKETYEKNTKLRCPLRIKKYVRKKGYLKWACDNLLARHHDIEKDYVYLWAYYAEDYLRQIFELLKPKIVILWNEFYGFHHIFGEMCKERNIKIVYMEFGSLPGTLSIEKTGQMGESYPAQYAKEFIRLPVTKGDKRNAKNVLTFLKANKLNRNRQPINNEIIRLKSKLHADRPIILYAGVNDFESGLAPYTNETKQWHSPVFHTSDEAALYLSKLGKKNNWNIIYKPHPAMFLFDAGSYDMYEDVIIANEVDINELIDLSDCVVTIFSQVSYVALIRERPTVLLGYNQLKGKGCGYEAYDISEVEQKIHEAICSGYTDMQKNAFLKHVAQMIKYNLFDDFVQKDIMYGQSVKAAADYILQDMPVKEVEQSLT